MQLEWQPSERSGERKRLTEKTLNPNIKKKKASLG